MLPTSRCTPDKLRLVVADLLTIGSHPISDDVDVLGDSRREQVDV